MKSLLPSEITSHVRIHTPYTGKLARRSLQDIFGIYVSFKTSMWDPASHNYYFRSTEEVLRIIGRMILKNGTNLRKNLLIVFCAKIY